jgi:uncharacterized membrane protein YcaP (DUF421 family)
MKKEEIFITDIKRILFGEAPPEFLIEVLLRTAFIYLFLLATLRILGKRMNGQLTITEMAVMIMLGAIISAPMQMPDRGLVIGIVILLSILVFHRGLNLWAFKNLRIENLTQGTMTLLVKNGVIQLKQLENSLITRQQLFSVLRNKKIYNLGRVKRLYLEGCGLFSVYEEESGKPGLPLLPPQDKHILKEQKFTEHAEQACNLCGFVKNHKETTCRNCGNNKWTAAIR